MACTYCVGAPDFEIKRYSYWAVYLKKNQAYPGTCIVALNRHVGDLWQCTPEELSELHVIMSRLAEVLKETFSAKMFSYVGQVSLENLHATMQIIPRYSERIKIGNYVFDDTTFGRGYDPIKMKELDPPMYSQLILKIKEKLGSDQPSHKEEPEVPLPDEQL